MNTPTFLNMQFFQLQSSFTLKHHLIIMQFFQLQTAVFPGSDAGSRKVDPVSGLVIENHLTSYSVWSNVRSMPGPHPGIFCGAIFSTR